jgi:phosphoribosylformylglycinamidine synthase
MKRFDITITVSLKEGLLDPEGKAMLDAIRNLGHAAESLRTARLFRLRLDAPDVEAARARARDICERLLANPVIHTYAIEVAQA